MVLTWFYMVLTFKPGHVMVKIQGFAMTSTFPFAQWPGLGPSDGGRDSADRGLPGSVGKPRDVMAKRRVEPSCESQGVRLGRPREAMAQLMTYESQDGAPFLSRLDGQKIF